MSTALHQTIDDDAGRARRRMRRRTSWTLMRRKTRRTSSTPSRERCAALATAHDRDARRAAVGRRRHRCRCSRASAPPTTPARRTCARCSASTAAARCGRSVRRIDDADRSAAGLCRGARVQLLGGRLCADCRRGRPPVAEKATAVLRTALAAIKAGVTTADVAEMIRAAAKPLSPASGDRARSPAGSGWRSKSRPIPTPATRSRRARSIR